MNWTWNPSALTTEPNQRGHTAKSVKLKWNALSSDLIPLGVWIWSMNTINMFIHPDFFYAINYNRWKKIDISKVLGNLTVTPLLWLMIARRIFSYPKIANSAALHASLVISGLLCSFATVVWSSRVQRTYLFNPFQVLLIKVRVENFETITVSKFGHYFSRGFSTS